MESQEQDTIQDIISELECPVCLDYMMPPIFVVCSSGHSVCSMCKEELDQECPTCRQPVVNIRNIVMEKVAKRVKYPCVNKKWGCYETFNIDAIIDHESECFYSNRQCPWSAVSHTCAWKGDTKDLKRHLTDSHADETEEVQDGVRLHLSISTYGYKTLFPGRIIATLGEVFIYCASFTDNNFYCIVQYVGPKSEASKYNYKFSVSRKGGAEKISVSHVVSSDTDDLYEIRETGNCVHLPCDLLKPYCTNGDKEEDRYCWFPLLRYSVKISKIEDTDK